MRTRTSPFTGIQFAQTKNDRSVTERLSVIDEIREKTLIVGQTYDEKKALIQSLDRCDTITHFQDTAEATHRSH